MSTPDFFEQSIEIILIILFIPVITLNIVSLAYVIYSKYLDFAKAAVKIIISLILGLLCIPVMTLALLYIFFNLIKYCSLQISPHGGNALGMFLVLFVIPVTILFSLCVSLGGGVFVSMISGFVLHKFLSE